MWIYSHYYILLKVEQRGEHDIENEMIFKSNRAFVFHDSCGFEAGTTSELKKVMDFMQKRSTNKNLRDHLHMIWWVTEWSHGSASEYILFRYCIPMNDTARPITKAELNFFAECGTGRGLYTIYNLLNLTFLLCTVPVIVLFTKADRLDAQTAKHLVKTGMSLEDAAIKAPEVSVAMFHENFGQQLYEKKYPPKDHVYFRGVTNSFICKQQINYIWQTCKIPQVTAVNFWKRQQMLFQMTQS